MTNKASNIYHLAPYGKHLATHNLEGRDNFVPSVLKT